MESPLLNFVFQTLKEQKLQISLVLLTQAANTTMHRHICGCFQHNTICCHDNGTMSNRVYNMKCQFCGQPNQYCQYLAYSETIVKSCSSCFSLNSQQKQESFQKAREMKKIDSQSSLFDASLVQSVQSHASKTKQSKMNSIISQSKQQKIDIKNIGKSFIIRTGKSQTQQDIAMLNKKIIINLHSAKPLPVECQSFLFAFPLQDFTESVQEDIVIYLTKQLPDTILKQKQPGTAYKLMKWIDALQQLRNAQTMNNKNVLIDGMIYKQISMPWDSNQVQTTFLQVMKLLQIFDPSLIYLDVTNLGQQLENINSLVYIDQSCQLCRNIAVRKCILEKCAAANHIMQYSDILIKLGQFVYYPTRDYQTLITSEQKKKNKIQTGIDCEKSNLESLPYQQFFQEYVDQTAAPFPYLDCQNTCTSQGHTFSHAQMARTLYRICYSNNDPFLQTYIINLDYNANHQSESIGSVVNLVKVLQRNVKLQEDANVQLYLQNVMQYVDSKPAIRIGSFLNPMQMPDQIEYRPVTPIFNQNINNLKFSQEDFVIKDYQQAVACDSLDIQNAKVYASEQMNYLQNINVDIKQYQRPDLFQIISQIQIQSPNSKTSNIKCIKIHPSLPFVAAFCQESGLSLFNLQKKSNTNTIDTDSLCDCSPITLRDEILYHEHSYIPQHIRNYTQLMEDYAPTFENMFYAQIMDRDVEAQSCPICQSLKQENNFNQHLRDYDKFDRMFQHAQDTTRKYTNDGDNELTEFFELDACPFVSYPQCLRQKMRREACITAIDFINTRTTFQLLTTSSEDGIFSIYQNPFDFGCSRQTTAFRVFDKQYVAEGPLGVIPILDTLRRIQNVKNVGVESYMRKDLFQIYLYSRINACMSPLEQANQVSQTKYQFLTSINQNNENVLFAKGQDIKLIDLQKEYTLFSKQSQETDNLGLSPITSIHMNNNLMSFGDVDGNFQVFDIRMNQRVNLHKFTSAVTSIYSESSDLFSAYCDDGSFQRIQQGKVMSQAQSKGGSGTVFQNVGGYAQGELGIIGTFDMKDQRVEGRATRVEKFQGAEWKKGMEMCATWNGSAIRVYGKQQ